MHDCVARQKLVKWLAKDGRTQAELARILGVSQPSIFAWFKGTSRPEPHLRAVLEELTGISVNEWETGDERTKREAALKRVRRGSAA